MLPGLFSKAAKDIVKQTVGDAARAGAGTVVALGIWKGSNLIFSSVPNAPVLSLPDRPPSPPPMF